MHELGIVFYIIRDAKEVAIINNVKEISSLTLELGEVSGVIPKYLEDCWKWAIQKEEMFTNCSLIIEEIKAKTFCEDCKNEYETVKYGKICPNCHSSNTYLITGNEVNIKEIEVK